MNNGKLAILGASARAAAASAVRAGYSVTACDLFADADLQRIATAHRVVKYPEGFVEWLAQQDCESWLYTGGLENHPRLIDRLAKAQNLAGNCGAVLREVRSPNRLAKTLTRTGLLFPETRDSPPDLPVDGLQEGTWLMKTGRSAGGSGVKAWTAFEQSDATNGETVFYQRRLIGKPGSAVFVGNSRQAALLGATEQLIGESWAGAEGFKYCGSVGPLLLTKEQLRSVERLGQTLAAEFELRGLFGVDLILADERVWTLEVNPRWTASVELLERAYGFNAIEIHLKACTTDTLPETAAPPRQLDKIYAKAILYAERELRFPAELTAACLGESGVEVPTIADVPVAGTHISEHHPVCSLFATGATSEQALASLRTNVETIRNRCESKYDADRVRSSACRRLEVSDGA